MPCGPTTVTKVQVSRMPGVLTVSRASLPQHYFESSLQMLCLLHHRQLRAILGSVVGAEHHGRILFIGKRINVCADVPLTSYNQLHTSTATRFPSSSEPVTAFSLSLLHFESKGPI